MRRNSPCTPLFLRRWREISADETPAFAQGYGAAGWEVWKFPYPSADRSHWFVIISQSAWCENEQNPVVNGLLCSTLRPPGRELKAHEVRLDAADGMDWDTVVKCSHVHELPKVRAAERRGPVVLPRQRKIALTLRACLGLG